ncbi:MAG: aminotransferase class V-fold PLP-dependent enzyme, partial [Methylococcaceae bacterium]|nr:aminotransferase class V-fold PLP-dependent enzyme [Methylococcaceae bacterium]
ILFAHDAPRLPNTVQFGLPGIDGETLVMALDRKGFAVSSGSACASGAGEPSPILLAMGVKPESAKSAIRVSLGKDNGETDIDDFLAALKAIATR